MTDEQKFYIRQTRNVAIAIVVFFFGTFVACTYSEQAAKRHVLEMYRLQSASPGYRLIEVK